MTTLTEADEGKRVVDNNGKTVGMIKQVSNDSAFVDPDAGLTDRIKSRLGWDDPDESDYMLETHRIAEVTDEEVRLR